MIPFITLFTAVFYIIYLGHAYLTKLNEMYKLDIPNSNLNEEKEENKNTPKELDNQKLLEDK